MDKPLYLFVGKSASGKTTVANILEQEHGYKQVQSYTTREPRYEGETGHIFVSREEFKKLGKLAAYTVYNGNEYGTTFKQLEECDIYVIDVQGVKTLLEKNIDRRIVIIYFSSSVYDRIWRMINRKDSDRAIVNRLLQDEKSDWSLDLLEMLENYHGDNNVNLHFIPNEGSRDDVVRSILDVINKEN